jgi:nucleoside 2-deoxyribosyltransferase
MNCYICGGDLAINDGLQSSGDEFRVNCSRCGTYKISRSAAAVMECKEADYRLSAYVRERSIRDQPLVELDTYSIEAIVNSLPDYSVSEKQTRLLDNLAGMSIYPGYGVGISSDQDFVLAWSDSVQEFNYYLESLTDRGLLKADLAKTYDGLIGPVTITPNGWNLLEKLNMQPSDSNQAFVAMSFSDELETLYSQSIKPSIESAGYRSYRVDKSLHIERIDAKIVAEIRKSKFIVADVTQQKQGVYYEAGFAAGLDIPVIWTVRQDDLENVHFDTRQYAHILWKDAQDLKMKLRSVIEAVIGRGPL